MPRRLFFALGPAILIALALITAFQLLHPTFVRADVSGVSANAPTFSKGESLTITVNAEDDDGTLTIISNLPSSDLVVTNCSGFGSKKAGRCDGSGMLAVNGQGTAYIAIDTDALDSDDNVEPLTVTLTLAASCKEPTAVTITANQPGNVGPDDVTLNCVPPTPTPTPTSTPTRTPTPTPSPTPSSTPSPTVSPSATPVIGTFTSTIQPPNTGDGGLW